MTYQEDGQIKLRRHSSKRAITLAMKGQWKEAIVINKSMIDAFPNDVDAYNRLGRAYMELKEYPQSREAYKRATELDPYNTIAKKNLHRLLYLEKIKTDLENGSHKAEPMHFIEEAGKSGVVNLSHPASQEILAKMGAGDRVYVKIDEPLLIVENSRGEYLGEVEPKHGQRLIKLIKGGNKYTAAIVSLTQNRVSVIIRETFQDPDQAGRLSFPSRNFEDLRPYVSDRLPAYDFGKEDTLPEELTNSNNDTTSYEEGEA